MAEVRIDRLNEQIRELRRELRLRGHVYARRVAIGTMTQGDAAVQTQLLAEALRTLELLRDFGAVSVTGYTPALV